MSLARTVLIVEDDVAFAEFLRAAVESVGHRAVTVTSGAAALATFREHRPDLVLLDILLPQQDGFDTCLQIRADEHGSTVPVALMTGIYKKASYERQGLKDCGATEYLHKPFGVQVLWRVLETHLGSVTGDAEPDQPSALADLARTPLSSVLAEHLELESNGVLFVRAGAATYAIYLQWGEPVFVRSNDPAHRLHAVLQRSGQVTPEQVRDALDAVAESNGRLRLGQALVRRGVLSEEQFQVALQLQLRMIFQGACQLSHGKCSFLPGRHPTEEDVLLAARPRALLILGSKNCGNRQARAAELPSDEATLARGGDLDAMGEELGLKPHERALAELADGTLTVGRFRAVAEAAGCDGDGLLHGFLLTGIVEAGAAPEAAPRVGARSTTEWDAQRFARLPVAAALADLHRTGASGTLEVRAQPEGPAKRLVFRAGSLVAVQSDVEEDRLADMLVKLELVSEAVLDGLLDTFGDVEPDDHALAGALVTSGHVLPLQVYWAAVYQAQAAVQGLHALLGGGLTWRGGEEPEATVALPDLPSAEVVWSAVRSLSGAALHVLLPPKQTRFRAADDARRRAATMPLHEEESALLERLSEPVSLEALLEAEQVDRKRLRRSLFGLLACRLVHEAASVEQERRQAEQALDELADSGADFLDLLHEDAYGPGAAPESVEPTRGSGGPAEREVAMDAPLDIEVDADGPLAPIDAPPAVRPDPAARPGGPVELSRELLSLLAATRAAVSDPDKPLSPHREALSELLDRCEALAHAVLQEAGQPVEGPCSPAGSGTAR